MTGAHLDLFSGVGGFALAAKWAGYTTVQFVEIDPFCQRVLRKHWPDVPIHDDIRTFSVDALGRIDLLTGGFPCQPHSVAGKRRGAADDRHLWPEMARVIAEVRPRFVVAENVAGLISLALDDCLTDLESLGYTCGAVVLPACAVNAPHRRDRVWIFAADADYAELKARRGDRLGARESTGTSARHGDTAPHPDTSDGGVRRGTASGRDGLAAQLGEGTAADADASGPQERNGRGPRNTQPATVERDGRDAESGVRRVDDGLSRGLDGPDWYGGSVTMPPPLAGKMPDRAARLKALGNAIVPQVAYEIIRLLPEMPA